ncbi:MAG: hypothetical protein ACK46X_17190 [Candidatus Sericytochromatia bacterium]
MERWMDHIWGRAIAAGMVAAQAMGLYIMVAMALSGLGFWSYPNIVAAAFPGFRPPTASFTPIATAIGAWSHVLVGAAIAIPYGLMTWAIAPAIDKRVPRELITGLLYGGLVYVVMGKLIAPLVNPAMPMVPEAHWVVGHLIFGVVTALLVAASARRYEPPVTFAPEVKAEAPTSRL